MTEIDIVGWQDDIKAALLAFAIDDRYAVAMARRANIILRRRARSVHNPAVKSSCR